MPWNYRVMKHMDRNPLHDKDAEIPEYDTWYAIHEVFYQEDGTHDGWTVGEIAPIGDSPEELKSTLMMMLEALNKPVLNYPKDTP